MAADIVPRSSYFHAYAPPQSGRTNSVFMIASAHGSPDVIYELAMTIGIARQWPRPGCARDDRRAMLPALRNDCRADPPASAVNAAADVHATCAQYAGWSLIRHVASAHFGGRHSRTDESACCAATLI